MGILAVLVTKCILDVLFEEKTHFGYPGILPIDFATGNIQFLVEEVHSYPRAIQRVCNFIVRALL